MLGRLLFLSGLLATADAAFNLSQSTQSSSLGASQGRRNISEQESRVNEERKTQKLSLSNQRCFEYNQKTVVLSTPLVFSYIHKGIPGCRHLLHGTLVDKLAAVSGRRRSLFQEPAPSSSTQRTLRSDILAGENKGCSDSITKRGSLLQTSYSGLCIQVYLLALS